MSAIAKEIARQIGNQAFAMMGVRQAWHDGDTLVFKIKGSPWKMIRITLDPSDTYSVEFLKLNGESKKISDVYVDVLHDVIEGETGLYLSLFPRGR